MAVWSVANATKRSHDDDPNGAKSGYQRTIAVFLGEQRIDAKVVYPFTYDSFSATFPSRTRNTSTPRMWPSPHE